MLCQKCGEDLVEEANYCSSCGVPISAQPSSELNENVQPEDKPTQPAQLLDVTEEPFRLSRALAYAFFLGLFTPVIGNQEEFWVEKGVLVIAAMLVAMILFYFERLIRRLLHYDTTAFLTAIIQGCALAFVIGLMSTGDVAQALGSTMFWGVVVAGMFKLEHRKPKVLGIPTK